MRVFIWGTGQLTQEYLQGNEQDNYELLGFIESNKTKHTFYNNPVYDPREILDIKFDYILVCVCFAASSIFRLCNDLGISNKKVLFADNIDWSSVDISKPLRNQWWKEVNAEQDREKIREIFPYFSSFVEERYLTASRYHFVLKNGFDLVEKDNPLQTPQFEDSIYQMDYCRFRTFELVANEILKNNVDGAVAEVGVFKGTFSRLINSKFMHKSLYLFDTFESFKEKEFTEEVEKGRCDNNFFARFKNTSEESVLKNMLYPDKCIVRKGFFPETAVGLENITYAFVSIDVDFEKSILESLRYFYPRLNEGGAIFIHDYNNHFLEGVKKAVATFEEEIGFILKKVPIADEGGTLIVVK